MWVHPGTKGVPFENGQTTAAKTAYNEEVFKGIVEVIKYKLLGITMKDSKAVRPYNDIFLVSWSSLEVTVPISVL
ncbi:hypothetical protein Tco_0227155 [Tanacetum coccineum]